MIFSTDYNTIVEKIEAINPVKYAKTRNYLDGDVTYLSPYISRGVISVKQVLLQQIKKGYKLYEIEKFVQELCWREYWQRNWQDKGKAILTDLKQEQRPLKNYKIATNIVNSNCGIDAVNRGITELYETGYMHNHLRMYTASICCNIAQNHWLKPAQWLYYHLLDGDLASNHLSWQWVAGTNSSKKYYCNQENISRYTNSNQKRSYLAHDYEYIADMGIPEELIEAIELELLTPLPVKKEITIDSSKKTLIYNSYNVDPNWRSNDDANKILLIEPSHFEQFPVSEKVIDFILKLGENINGLQVYVGEFSELIANYQLNKADIYFKEHPTCTHYKGIEEPREWIASNTEGSFNSFFSFYKKAEKEIRPLFG
jgi:deoxyribodipyrimidine photo-lyase